MTPNWIGVVAAGATLLAVWFGHVGVRKVEAVSPAHWRPAAVALALGLGLEMGALVSINPYVSGVLGIIGMTVMWDALEFARQHNRVKRGHAPANPRNARHARLLAENGAATSLDWLKRDPVGRRVGPEEAVALVQAQERSK